MLFLKNIYIYQFRNISQAKYLFSKPCNAIVGENGIGKTNLLNALYYLAFSKPYKSSLKDADNIQISKNEMSIKGDFILHEKNIQIQFQIQQEKKKLYINEVPEPKLTSQIGKILLVIITPDDINIINGSSEERRTFIDGFLAQNDIQYLENLLIYKKVLKIRNHYLKEKNTIHIDTNYLDSLDAKLIATGNYIFQKRNEIFSSLESYVYSIYQQLSDTKDSIKIDYTSDIKEQSFEQILKQNRSIDIRAKRTSKGIHKDDIHFYINNLKAKDTASQGQKKSLLFALKLSIFEMLKDKYNYSPLLLLDDLFEKLDEKRIQNLLSYLKEKKDLQLFITDTNLERIETHFQNWEIDIHKIS